MSFNAGDYHTPDCGTKYRGCAPRCPAETYWDTGEWIGPSFASRWIKQLGRVLVSVLELVTGQVS